MIWKLGMVYWCLVLRYKIIFYLRESNRVHRVFNLIQWVSSWDYIYTFLSSKFKFSHLNVYINLRYLYLILFYTFLFHRKWVCFRRIISIILGIYEPIIWMDQIFTSCFCTTNIDLFIKEISITVETIN